jgi:NAD(P)-dependent dehydrogenase (short-subunit alcohol dehydrogenase family)
MQNTIFITGASAGLGKATAKLFQRKGWKVIATMRNPEKETELNQLENVILMPLDVTNTRQIENVVKNAIELSEIDVVFNNAGYGLIGPLEALADEQIVKEINTNLLGVIRVTQEFVPYFKKRKKGLFITTTSIGGLISFPFSSIYHATKWALEGWTESMSYELSLFDIGIKTVAPGGIRTDFAGRSLDLISHPDYGDALAKLMTLLNPDDFSSAEAVAETVYEAATDGKKQLRYIAGQDANAYYSRRLELGQDAFRKELSETLFGQ